MSLVIIKLGLIASQECRDHFGCVSTFFARQAVLGMRPWFCAGMCMHNIWELISKDCVNDWTQDASLKLANNAAVDRGVRELKSRLSDNLKARTEYL